MTTVTAETLAKDKTSATLSATCTATVDGVSVSPTSVGFRYGATTTSADWYDVPCTPSSQFSTTLTGLTPHTKYYYIAYAVVNGKETKSSRHEVTTLKDLEMSVTSYEATNKTTSSATLSATYSILHNGASVAPTKAGFCWGTSSAGINRENADTKEVSATSGSFAYTLTGLEAGTTYHWKAWVEYDGETKYTNAREFTTAAAENTTPVVDASWLELPAVMDGTSYEKATVWTVKNGTTRNYTIAYDTSKYATYWVAYNLKSSHMGSLSRPNSWNYDTTAGAPATSLQVNVDNTYDTYNNGAGHAKGHLIPNASRNGIEAMQLQTFYYPNSVPQIHNGFNGGVWQSLEKALQDIGKSEEIFIVTGTAFSKVGESKTISYTSTPSDSRKSVPIPNYFYKVVLKVEKNSSGTVTSASTIGFWFENKYYSGVSYTDFTVSVDQIEKWTGLNFFVNLSDSIEESAESNTSWSAFQSF